MAPVSHFNVQKNLKIKVDPVPAQLPGSDSDRLVGQLNLSSGFGRS